MATKAELIQRWDTFLANIEQRFEASLGHAEEACVSQLKDSNFDYYTTIKTWMGIKAQIYQLIQKIRDTWHGKVEPQMRMHGDFWMEESRKSYELSDALTDRLGYFQLLLESKLSGMYYDHAIALANRDFNCSQCHAKLEIIKNLFRAQYVTCPYCQTVNTFEPETKFVHLSDLVDNIARHNCLTQYNSMQEKADALRKQRNPVPEKYWSEYEEAYFEYYTCFFQERIKLKPDAEKRLKADMERKQKEFDTYKNVYLK